MCGSLLQSMIGMHGFEAGALAAIGGIKAAVVLAALLVIVFFAPNLWQIKFKPSFSMAIAMATLFVVCVLRFDCESPFLYFQF